MGTTYAQDVAACTQHVLKGDEHQWESARLTFERTVANLHGPQRPPEGKVSIRQWARDVEVYGHQYFANLRRVWEEFGAQRDKLSFAEAFNRVVGRDKATSWQTMEAEVDALCAHYVTTFRKYEGMETDETDDGRVVKVTQQSFARHMGIPQATFRRWLTKS
jgi:hypothetical protein